MDKKRKRRAIGLGVVLLPILVLAAVLCGGCLTVPLAPEKPEDKAFTPVKPTTVGVELTPLQMGHRRVPRCVVAGEASCFSPAEVVHVAYLVRHPKGTFLIDAGLSSHGRDDLARFGFSERVGLDWVSDGDLKSDLAAAGSPHIDFVLLTHAHWDHTSGLVDLSSPRVLVGAGEEAFARGYHADEIPAVMMDHLKGAHVEEVTWDGGPYENFPRSHDLFGDQSVVLVPLPGHTPGSMGVFLNDFHGRRLLFIGDAAWSRSGVDLPSHKSTLVSPKVDAEPEVLAQTLWRLHELHLREPRLVIVPAHDGDALDEVRTIRKSR